MSGVDVIPAREGSSGVRGSVLSAIGFVALMAAVFALPYVHAASDLADDLTRNTVRVSLLFYAVAIGLLLLRCPEDLDLLRLARVEWTLAWAGYIIHLIVAFQIYHHGSHAEAVEHVREAAGVGAGIYVSHLFTLVWTLDVTFWWLAPARHEGRAAWIGGLLHGFMAFIVFNATVVFETGAIRWTGVALFAVFAVLLGRRFTNSTPRREESV